MTCSESHIQESSDQRFTHRQPASGAHTLNCDLVLLPGAPPTSKPEPFSGQDRTEQPRFCANETGNGLPSQLQELPAMCSGLGEGTDV